MRFALSCSIALAMLTYCGPSGLKLPSGVKSLTTSGFISSKLLWHLSWRTRDTKQLQILTSEGKELCKVALERFTSKVYVAADGKQLMVLDQITHTEGNLTRAKLKIKIFDLACGLKQSFIFPSSAADTQAAALSGGGRLAAFAHKDYESKQVRISIYDFESQELVKLSDVDRGLVFRIKDLIFNDLTKSLLAIDHYDHLYIYRRLETNVKPVKVSLKPINFGRYQRHRFFADRRFIYLGTKDDAFKVFSKKANALVSYLEFGHLPARSVVVGSDGDLTCAVWDERSSDTPDYTLACYNLKGVKFNRIYQNNLGDFTADGYPVAAITVDESLMSVLLLSGNHLYSHQVQLPK